MTRHVLLATRLYDKACTACYQAAANSCSHLTSQLCTNKKTSEKRRDVWQNESYEEDEDNGQWRLHGGKRVKT